MGKIPLYKGANKEEPPDAGNTGLWYDKFCNTWQQLSSDQTKLDKREWINTVAGSHCGHYSALQDYAGRREKLINFLNGRCIELISFEPFVAGLGREHPVENGFLWHHCFGVPYLPGSSVKGLAHAWAKYWKGEDETLYKGIFGSEDQVGEIVFLDALPTKPVQLRFDVITPHYGEYENGGNPPGDWISPVPIPFLSIADGAKFQFAFAPRRKSAEAHLDVVCKWVECGLEWLGAGARTAVGYGRFGKAKAPQPRDLKKSDSIKVTIFIDKRGRWCGRTDDGREGTVFPPKDAPSDVVVDQNRTLYVRNPQPLQFLWEKPRPKPLSVRSTKPSRRLPGKFRRH